MQQPIILSPKFEAKSSHIFTQSPQNVTAVCGIDCLVCQDEFFVNNPFHVKENDKHAFDSPLHLFPQSRRIWIFRVRLILSSLNARLIIARVYVTLFPRFEQNLIHTRCCFVVSTVNSHQARYTTPNTRTSKNQHIHPAASNFVH
jgi:hypothetical protein